MKTRLIVYISLLIITGLAVLFRTEDIFSTVFSPDGEIFFFGTDPYFYLRQVETACKNFPQLQNFDHATHFPQGVDSDLTGLYTWLLAGISYILYGADATSSQIASMMAWVPIAFVIGNCILLFLIVRKLRDEVAAIIASFLFLLYPGLSLYRGMLGFPDHHIIEMFLGLWLVYALLRIEDFIRNDKLYRLPVLASIPLVLYFVIWSGAPLYLLLAPTMLFLYLLQVSLKNGEIKSASKFATVYFFSAAGMYLMIKWFVPAILTSFFTQYDYLIAPILVLTGIGFFVLPLLLNFIYKFLKEPHTKILMLTLFIIGLTLFFNYIGVGKSVWNKLTYALPGVLERNPVGLLDYLDMIAIPGIIAIVYAVFYVIKSFSGSISRRTDVMVLFISMFFIFMWLSTYDMDYMVSQFVCITAGIALYDIMLWANKKSYDHKGLKSILISIVPGLIFLGCLAKPFIIKSSKYKFRVEKEKEKPLYTSAWYKAMDWLKENTPTLPYPTDSNYTRGEYIPEKEGNYGVLTAWDYGNIVNQRGHRIPSWSRWSQPSNEKLFVDPADSLLFKLTKENIKYKYLVVSLSMVKNFMAKYKILDYSLDPCYGSKTIHYNGNPTVLNVYGECYQNSLLYNIYVERDTSLTWIKEVYRSDIEIVFGYVQKKEEVSIIGFDARAYNAQDIAKILERGYIGTKDGLLYDLHLSPEIVIYEIIPPSIVDDKNELNSQ